MDPIDFLRGQHPELTALRRDLHAHPELGFEEHRTAQVVTGELDKLGVEYHTGVGRTGVVAVVPGARQDSGRAVGLRADMDALPMHE
jgi:metal-dependent amidase/aminoacylase/carboxypeptidase family protein